MMIRTSADTLHRTEWSDYAVRFAFGGAITVIAGIIARKFGPELGGLFLAFPAIFPAAATLAARHEREKKQERGLSGETRGKLVAGSEACGSALGSIGLVAFALLFWLAVPTMKLWLLFPLAILTWFAVSGTLWLLRKRLPLLRGTHPERRRSRSASIHGGSGN